MKTFVHTKVDLGPSYISTLSLLPSPIHMQLMLPLTMGFLAFGCWYAGPHQMCARTDAHPQVIRSAGCLLYLQDSVASALVVPPTSLSDQYEQSLCFIPLVSRNLSQSYAYPSEVMIEQQELKTKVQKTRRDRGHSSVQWRFWTRRRSHFPG